MSKILTQDSFTDMPWKNGGGTTREIFKISNPKNPEQFYFRLSMATVSQDGPFSKFPGIDRFLMLLKGNGFVLNKSIRFGAPLDQLFFKGEDDVKCELINGPCTDFNVMTDRNWGKSSVIVTKMKPQDVMIFDCSYLYLHSNESQLVILQKGESYPFEAEVETIAIAIDVTLIH